MVLGFNDRITVPASVSEPQRFGFLVVGMFCSLAAGAVYAFSLISDKMDSEYGFSQNDITTVSTVGLVFGYFTLPFGFIFDYFGPKPIFVIGVLAFSVGAILFALTFQDTIGHSVASLSLINAVMNMGSGMFDMASILSILSWFPVDRGYLVAAAKTMTGLASAVIATVYNTYFSGNHTGYMYFLLGLVVVLGTVGFVYIHLPPYHMTGYRLKHYTEEDHEVARRVEHLYMTTRAPRWRFIFIFVIVISLLVVITTQSIVFVFLGEDVSFAQRNPPAIIMIVLYCLLCLAILPCPWLDKSGTKSDSSVEPLEESGNGEGVNLPAQQSNDMVADAQEEKLLSNDDKNFPQYRTGFFYNLLHNVPLWCLWLNAIVLSGGVSIITFNTRQIFVAISEDPTEIRIPNLYVALLSVGSALSRLGVSFFEAWNASRPMEKRIPIIIAYFVPSCFLCLSSILFLVVPAKALILPMLFGGFVNGSYAATLVLTVRTIYSIDVAKHYNSIFLFDLAGAIIFNRLLFGETVTKKSFTDGDGNVRCFGRKCIQTSFIVLACFSALAFCATLLMYVSYMRFVRATRKEKEQVPQEEMMDFAVGPLN
ncbi:Major facilitator superfamily [Trypanosoma melophagium]|uniref:Major facilitator superfamily n=1 Tax=Trypanosoma melophagium TaxID=715481 RepID=UPI00351A352D|nr:Major facilitator superfamily [Trypanosoma melophagium]